MAVVQEGAEPQHLERDQNDELLLFKLAEAVTQIDEVAHAVVDGRQSLKIDAQGTFGRDIAAIREIDDDGFGEDEPENDEGKILNELLDNFASDFTSLYGDSH